MARYVAMQHPSRAATADANAGRAAEVAYAQALPATPSATVGVHVFNFDFSLNAQGGTIVDPVISVGDTVTWTWDGGFHSVTSVAGSAEPFNSGDHTPAFSFSHTYTQVGTFAYYCDIHGSDNGNGTANGMVGFVTVRAVPEPALLAAAAVLAPLVRRRR